MQLFVLGMHRSGTSMVTRLLNMMGAYFGPENVGMRPATDNLKGFWERRDVYELNEDLFNTQSTSWFQISDFHPDKLSKEQKEYYQKEASRIIFDMDSHRPWVIKDPRICLTFPLWKDLLEVPVCIHVHRNPYEVALSLKKRNDFPIPFGIALWEEYILRSFEASRGLPRLFVMHEQLITAPQETVEKLFNELKAIGVQGLRMPSSKELSAFLSTSLYQSRDEKNHHRSLLTSGQKAICKAIEEEDVTWLENARGRIDYPGRLDLLELYNNFQRTADQVTATKEELKIATERSVKVESELSNLSGKLLQEAEKNTALKQDIQNNEERANARISNLEKEKQSVIQSYEKTIEKLETTFKTQLESLYNSHSQNTSILAVTRSKLNALEVSSQSVRREKLKLEQIAGKLKDQLTDLESSFQAEKKQLISENEKNNQQVQAIEETLSQAIIALQKSINSYDFEIDSIFFTENEHLEKLKGKYLHHLREIEAAHQANLNSWRWKIGHTIVRFLERILGRKQPQLGVELITEVIKKLEGDIRILKLSQKIHKESIPNFDLNHFKEVLFQFRQFRARISENNKLNGAFSTRSEARSLALLPPDEKQFRILYISPHLPDFDTSSGGKRAFRMLSILAESCQVHAFTLGNRPYHHQVALEKAGVKVFETNTLEKVRDSLTAVDAIIFAWYYTYFDCIALTQYFPKAKIIVDTVDVHWVREERSLGLLAGLTEERILANKKREISAYRNADIVWAVTENDKLAILKELPHTDVQVVSNIHRAIRKEFKPTPNGNILFFGGYQHYPNISAVRTLALDIFPRIRQEIPNAKLLIAGSKAPPEVSELGQLEGVDFLGFIEDTQIDDLYSRTALIVAPLLAGAGIKGKICEAATYMIPVVTNAIGNEGIQFRNEVDAFITEDFREMARYSIEILKGKYDLSQITENAQKKILEIVGPDNVRRAMINSLAKPVSICIVTWNRLEFLKDCIQSIIDYTVYPNFVILVHSNGCTDGTQEYLNDLAASDPRIIPILSKTNDVFVKPNNAMMKMVPGNDAVLVNNDVTVTKGWLLEMYRTAYSSEKVGIVGAKILFPDGKLQEFGSELYADGTGRNIGKWDDPDKPVYQEVKKAGYVSGCAMFIKADTINRIGVFDEQFHPCYCEDSDYCYTAWENQIETLVTPKSVIYHFEGGTSGTDTDKGFKTYQSINMQKFLRKHKGKKNGIIWGDDKKVDSDINISFCKKLQISFESKYSDDFGKDLIKDTQLEEGPVERFTFSEIRSFREFLNYEKEMKDVYAKRISIEKEISQSIEGDTGQLWGFNPMIKENVPYLIKRRLKENGESQVNFRETITCPVTRVNSRLRATAMILEEISRETDLSKLKVYFLEQKTSWFNFYKTKFPNLIGSEYFGPAFKSGELVNGIRHEDLTGLSFDDNSFDIIVALEILEHVPDFRKGLKEMYRCLDKGGKAIITVPFLKQAKKTRIRATIDETGKITHLLTPEYHGDPVKSSEGILCFYHFGWDFLNELKSAGFRDVKALFGWSLYHGILGKDSMVILAEK